MAAQVMTRAKRSSHINRQVRLESLQARCSMQDTCTIRRCRRNPTAAGIPENYPHHVPGLPCCEQAQQMSRHRRSLGDGFGGEGHDPWHGLLGQVHVLILEFGFVSTGLTTPHDILQRFATTVSAKPTRHQAFGLWSCVSRQFEHEI